MSISNRPLVKFRKIDAAATIPDRKTNSAAGFDLTAVDFITLPPGGRVKVRTGFQMEMPPNIEAQVRPRSGLAINHGVTVLNAPGTIDADYRGEVAVILINHSNERFDIHPGMRVAQLVFATVLNELDFSLETDLSETERGAGGFGSTGH